jgi:YVTN family beta-propeller protein
MQVMATRWYLSTPATGTAGKPIKVAEIPRAIAVTPDGKTAYVASDGSATVTPISTADNRAGTPIKVGLRPVAIAVTPARIGWPPFDRHG